MEACMEEGTRFDRKRFLAANSSLHLKTVCRRLEERFGLPEFGYDLESEGEDFWEYARSVGEALALNVTRIGRFVTPSSWHWMWGAPDRANFQVILYWTSSRVDESGVRDVMEVLAEVFEAELRPYPGYGDLA